MNKRYAFGEIAFAAVLGNENDRWTYLFICGHRDDEEVIDAAEVKDRARKLKAWTGREEREHFLAHQAGLPAQMYGFFPHFPAELEGDVLMSYAYSDGRAWYGDQVQLRGGRFDRRSLFVMRARPTNPPNCC